MKNHLLVIIFTIVGLAIYIGFFYYQHLHLQGKQKSKTLKKQQQHASAVDERASNFGGRKKRKLKK